MISVDEQTELLHEERAVTEHVARVRLPNPSTAANDPDAARRRAEMLDRVRRLYVEEELSVRVIGLRVGAATTSVVRWLRMMGVQMRARGVRAQPLRDLRGEAARDLLRAGWDPEKAAFVLGVSEESVEALQQEEHGQRTLRRSSAMVRRKKERKRHIGQLAMWPGE
jgi:hypothetical protein